MKLKLNKDNPLITGLSILFVVSAFEIIAYFFYIYKPASHIFGKGGGYQLEIPAVSQILKNSQITDESISLDDSNKAIFPDKMFGFKTLLDKKLARENTFVKDARMSYVVAGNVTNVKKTEKGGITLTLKNSGNQETKETFSEEEIKNITVFLVTITPPNASRVQTSLENITGGDYFIMKVSSNLLTKDSVTPTEVEVIRTVK